MKKRIVYILTGIGILAIILILAVFRGNEDTWLKDEKGVWVKHGNPSAIPDKVKAQQEAINCANERYKFYSGKIEFNSQCLGRCGNYAVDIVHVPRNAEDNLAENQCTDFLEKKVSSFIELNKNGNIVRVAD
jgi:hypothetical protein